MHANANLQAIVSLNLAFPLKLRKEDVRLPAKASFYEGSGESSPRGGGTRVPKCQLRVHSHTTESKIQCRPPRICATPISPRQILPGHPIHRLKLPLAPLIAIKQAIPDEHTLLGLLTPYPLADLLERDTDADDQRQR
jgi:hypothetical protein